MPVSVDLPLKLDMRVVVVTSEILSQKLALGTLSPSDVNEVKSVSATLVSRVTDLNTKLQVL